ncbi:hypothetical protein FC98_GL000833 [Lentilactobacillus kisonensis DSM 19906 = JCM 15041]|uniref:Uncharacterized protein n=1 Tax=Lentilactobacillus kisonensis DSM 19906 = JCM 15041 TaxID=1423766 RepID=A0A0R1NX37_9LACO|nr:hypothetical protein FC98_GL000833 [Lentilactobacillus kisonensis DSM 19906 = JCM 15041]
MENLIARAFPVFKIEMFAMVMPTSLDNSVTDIFRLANITSRLTTIAIVSPHTVY